MISRMKYYTKQEALNYLAARGITVSTRALNNLIHANKPRCKPIGQRKHGMPSIWQIPQSLLDTYHPSARHQASGRTPKG